MPKPFYNRLIDYYARIGKVLRQRGKASSIFPNTTDIGQMRELTYADFLRAHAPSKCNIDYGGFLFSDNGEESNQLDIVIMSDAAPRYNFFNQNGGGKSFGPVEGCLGVACIKSNLNKKELFNSLKNIASIPRMQTLENRLDPSYKIDNYNDWPYKIVYASKGISPVTIMEYIQEFYSLNAEIPDFRKPNIIHVLGKYILVKPSKDLIFYNLNRTVQEPGIGNYHLFTTIPDLQGMLLTMNDLQSRASAATKINYNYNLLTNKLIMEELKSRNHLPRK